jgi:ABC-type Fe3+/spermidine/putrescine transport system ATPase subunit
VQIGPSESQLFGGSRLEGTVAEIVFLGMYTQFHVETAAGRLVAQRLSDDDGEALRPGSRMTLSWEPEQAYLLGA